MFTGVVRSVALANLFDGSLLLRKRSRKPPDIRYFLGTPFFPFRMTRGAIPLWFRSPEAAIYSRGIGGSIETCKRSRTGRCFVLWLSAEPPFGCPDVTNRWRGGHMHMPRPFSLHRCEANRRSDLDTMLRLPMLWLVTSARRQAPAVIVYSLLV